MAKRVTKRHLIQCSFCLTSRREVKALVLSDQAELSICDTCILAATEVLLEQGDVPVMETLVTDEQRRASFSRLNGEVTAMRERLAELQATVEDLQRQVGED